MKKLFYLTVAFIFLMPINNIFAQLKKSDCLTEIAYTIFNADKFLGKSPETILDKQWNDSIKGGSKWEFQVLPSKNDTLLNTSSTIIIDTGNAVIMLLVSKETNLIFTITYLPHRLCRLNGEKMMKYLTTNNGLIFDSHNKTLVPVKSKPYPVLGFTRGAFMIVSEDETNHTSK